MTRIRLIPISDGYRISVMNVRSKRNGSSIERIGFMQPKHHYTRLCVNASALKAWLNNGALPSKPVLKLFESLTLRK
ncbi:MAG: 30S ribosomal protein S16 [Candidatus Hodgkinia cicadicola]